MSFDDIAEVLSGMPLKLLAAFAQAIEAGRDGGLLENIGHPARGSLLRSRTSQTARAAE
jgi:hypothetical protein